MNRYEGQFLGSRSAPDDLNTVPQTLIDHEIESLDERDSDLLIVAAVLVIGFPSTDLGQEIIWKSRRMHKGKSSGRSAYEAQEAIDLDTRQMCLLSTALAGGMDKIRDLVRSSPDFSQGSFKNFKRMPPAVQEDGRRIALKPLK